MADPALLFCNHALVRLEYDAILAQAAKKAFGVSTILLTHGSKAAARGLAAGFDKAVDLSFSDDGSPSDENTVAELAAFEAESGGRTLREDIMQDRWLEGQFSFDWSLRYLASTRRKLDVLFSDHDVLAAVGEVNYAAFRLVRRMLAARRRPFLLAAWARLYDRFYLDPSFYSEHERCVSLYHEYMRTGVPYEAQREAAEAIRGIVDLRRGPNYQAASLRAVSGVTFAAKVRRALRRATHTHNGDGLPATAREREHLLPAARRLLAAAAARVRYERLASSEQPSGSYALYLMHTYPEYQVNTCGWPFRDEVFLIERIAESLPLDMTLIVKEHQLMLGRRPAKVYERITRRPNVRLVPVASNARDLIADSKVVVTISGNGAIEALAFGVPAIAFSPVFYTAFDGITRCRDLLDLPVLIRDAVRRGPSNRRAAEAAFAAMYSASRPGIPFIPNGTWSEPANLDLLTRSFVDELAELAPALEALRSAAASH